MTLYRIGLITVLLHLAYSGARVTLSLFALSLHASAATVGLLMSLLAIVPMIFAVSWGRYIDRIEVRTPMYVGAAAVFGALITVFAVPRLETLFIASAVSGSGFMFFHIAVNQAAGLIGKPQERARNFSVLALAFSVSSFLGPMTAGFAIDWLGHRYTFLLFAATLVATFAIMLVRPINVPRHAVALQPGEKKTGRPAAHSDVAPCFRGERTSFNGMGSLFLRHAYPWFALGSLRVDNRLDTRQLRIGGFRGTSRAAADRASFERVENADRRDVSLASVSHCCRS